MALYAYAPDSPARALAVSNCMLSGYQKNGMALNGEHLSRVPPRLHDHGRRRDRVHRAERHPDRLRSNGSITDCTVQDHMYTGGNWAATGILLFEASSVVSIANASPKQRTRHLLPG